MLLAQVSERPSEAFAFTWYFEMSSLGFGLEKHSKVCCLLWGFT